MREAAKINVDNTKFTEADEDWCRNFLYPDMRKPYLLFHNEQNYKHALELCAKVRRATLDEASKLTGRNLHSTKEPAKNDEALLKQMEDLLGTKMDWSPGEFVQQKSRIHRRRAEHRSIFDKFFGIFRK